MDEKVLRGLGGGEHEVDYTRFNQRMQQNAMRELTEHKIRARDHEKHVAQIQGRYDALRARADEAHRLLSELPPVKHAWSTADASALEKAVSVLARMEGE